MIWIGIIVVFGVIFFREERKKEKDSNYRSWMEGSHWDHWNHRKYGD